MLERKAGRGRYVFTHFDWNRGVNPCRNLSGARPLAVEDHRAWAQHRRCVLRRHALRNGQITRKKKARVGFTIKGM